MKLFKKVMSLIIASIMMLQVAAFAAPAPADVNGTFYEDAAKLLSALEIMVGDGNSFNGDNNITRAEFTKIMVAAAGHANIVAGYKPKGVFTDVPTTQWYAPYVEFGKDMGAINGMGDGIFAPNDNVTGEQAVKMMVCIIGYGLPAAEIGYPEGYVSVARDLGALKGIASVDLTQPMTRGQAAVLCANIMKVDVMKKVATGDKEEWTAQDGVTLLSDKFNAYELEGIVSANASTAIWETSTLKEGKVEITVGGVKKIFLVGDTDIDTKIGASVKFVYQYDDYEEESTVLCYTAHERNNTSVTVGFDQFDLDGTGAITKNTKGELQYWVSDDAKKADAVAIEARPAIIYNGVASTTTDSAEVFLRNKLNLVGNVTFLDANDVEGAETLIVTAYENIVIDYIDAESYDIFDTDINKKIQIDIEDKDVTATFVDKNGKELSFDSLQEGDVLSVAASDGLTGKRVFHVVVCNDIVSGVVKSFGNNEHGKFNVELDGGKQYEFSQYMSNLYSAGDLKLGREKSFKLDAFGKIVKIEASTEASVDGNFGLMLRYVKSLSTTGTYEVKVFTADGEFAILPLAAKVTIDGEKYNDATIEAALIAANAAAAENNAAFTVTPGTGACIFPMLYELDASGAIKYIDTPDTTEDEDEEYTLGAIKNDNKGVVGRTYSQYYKGFDNKIPFNASGKILAVPAAGGDFENEKNVYFMEQTDFDSKTHNLQLFNTNRESYAYTYGICVTAAGKTDLFRTAEDVSAQRQRPLFVATKTTLTLIQDEYGEDIETLKVYGNEEGASKNITIDPEYYANGAYDATGAADTLLNHIYYGVTFDTDGKNSRTSHFSDEHSVRAPSTARQSSVILPGDIFTYGTNAEGYVHYVRPIFLHEEKAFLSHNIIENSGRVLCAIDFAIPVEINGKDARFAKISNPDNKFNKFMMESLYDADSGTISKDINGAGITSAETIGGRETMDYDGDKLTVNDVRSIGSAKIIVVDMKAKNANQMVTTGFVTDIADTTIPGKATTPCILRNFGGTYAAIVVFKNL